MLTVEPRQCRFEAGSDASHWFGPWIIVARSGSLLLRWSEIKAFIDLMD